MGTVFPTTPTYTQVLAPTSYSSQAAPRATIPLNLQGKFGATLLVRIGRDAATALTRAGYLAARRTDNDTLVMPNSTRDCVSSTAAVNQTTVSSGGGSGATTVTVGSGTGYAAGQNVLLQLAGERAEFVTITDATSNVLTIDRSTGFRVGHNASDRVTNGADVFEIYLPGGDIWELTPVNNSGQTLIFAVDAIIDDTLTTT